VDAKASPKTSTKPKMSRQKQRIYELLVKATKGKVVAGRKMTTNFFFDEIKNLTTKLDPEPKTKGKDSTAPAGSPQATMDPMRAAVDNVMTAENNNITSNGDEDELIEIAEASRGSHGDGSRLLDDETDGSGGQQQRTVNYFNGDVEEENDLFIDSDDDAETEYVPEEMERNDSTSEETGETTSTSHETTGEETNSTNESTVPVPPDVTTIDGIRMKITPFNKLTLVNLRLKGNEKLLERNIVNTQHQRKRRMERKRKYRTELRAFWDLRNDIGDVNHQIFWNGNPNVQTTVQPWWRIKIDYKLQKCGRKIN
jgi:hypothetical protein